VCVCVCVCIHACIGVKPLALKQMSNNSCVRVRVLACQRACVCVFVSFMCVRACQRVRVYQRACVCVWVGVCICVYLCVYTCLYAFTSILDDKDTAGLFAMGERGSLRTHD